MLWKRSLMYLFTHSSLRASPTTLIPHRGKFEMFHLYYWKSFLDQPNGAFPTVLFLLLSWDVIQSACVSLVLPPCLFFFFCKCGQFPPCACVRHHSVLCSVCLQPFPPQASTETHRWFLIRPTRRPLLKTALLQWETGWPVSLTHTWQQL